MHSDTPNYALHNPGTPCGFSRFLDIRKLERESQRLLFIGFLLGVLLHAGSAVFVRFGKPVERTTALKTPPRPIKTDLIALPPRNREFLAVRPHPFLKRVMRPEIGAMPSPSDVRTSVYTRLPDILDRPYDVRVEPMEPTEPTEVKLDTDTRYIQVNTFDSLSVVERITAREFSLKDELLTVDDFVAENEWHEKGIVFLNPENSMTIRGVVPVPVLFGSSYPYPLLSQGIQGLAEAVGVFTNLVIPLKNNFIIQAGSPIRYPFIYIASGEVWDYHPSEVKVVGDYLRSGGFALFENLAPWMEQSPGEESLRQFIREALGSEARFDIIPNDHPVYHCLFDFPDGPPLGSEVKLMANQVMRKPVTFLEGVWLGSRMVAIYSNKGYGNVWLRRGDSDPQRKMGLNMLVFALLQEGGKVEKRFDRSLEPGVRVMRWLSGEQQLLSGATHSLRSTRERPRR